MCLTLNIEILKSSSRWIARKSYVLLAVVAISRWVDTVSPCFYLQTTQLQNIQNKRIKNKCDKNEQIARVKKNRIIASRSEKARKKTDPNRAPKKRPVDSSFWFRVANLSTPFFSVQGSTYPSIDRPFFKGILSRTNWTTLFHLVSSANQIITNNRNHYRYPFRSDYLHVTVIHKCAVNISMDHRCAAKVLRSKWFIHF